MTQIDLDDIANKVLEVLNSNGTDIVKGSFLNSPRAVGDAVQEFLAGDNGLATILKDLCIQVDNDFTRRSMEDLAFKSGHKT